MDYLTPLFARFSLSARVFFSGRLCGISDDHTAERGHLHLLRRGTLRVFQPKGNTMTLDQPSVLFYSRPMRHRLQASAEQDAEIVCAEVDFGAGMHNPLVQTLPEVLVLPLASIKELQPAAELLFAEAFGQGAGRPLAVNRLTEYFLILLLRQAVESGLVQGGILRAFSDPRLAKCITAIHEHPEDDWSLDLLARTAGMSRARFAVNFRRLAGVTPLDYLADWRIGVAQSLLKRGESLKLVAPAVGYGSQAALSRAFTRKVGVSPKNWLETYLEAAKR